MPSRRIAIFAGAALLLALLLFRGIPYLTQQREVIASTPTPNAITAVSPIALKPRSQICTNQVSYSPDSQVARFVTAGPLEPKGPPLAITASGPGYRAGAKVPGGYPGTGAVEVRLAPPNRSLIGEFCIRNAGRTQWCSPGRRRGGRWAAPSQRWTVPSCQRSCHSRSAAPTARRCCPGFARCSTTTRL
jgi:hypothetical protein